MEIVIGLKNFFEHFIKGMGNVFFAIVALLAYLIGYPSKILVLVLVFFVLDIITKFYALSVQNGGLIKAFMLGKISSKSFINGFVTKILGYFVLLVTANFAIITPEISFIGGAIATVIYIGLFFYEIISNLENLVQANFLAAIPILSKLKKEQEKFLETKIDDIQAQVEKTIETKETTKINNDVDG